MSPRALLCLVAASLPVASPALYLTVTKELYHAQSLFGRPELDPSAPGTFYGNLSDDTGLNLTNATLKSPDGSDIPLTANAAKDYFDATDYYATATDFSSAGKYRNGAYLFAITPTVAGNFSVTLTGNTYPDAPALADPFNADGYDATKVITLKLMPMLGAVATDKIYATIFDSDYTPVYSYSDQGIAIPYNATSLTVPANTLTPGTDYILNVSYNKSSASTQTGTLYKRAYFASATDMAFSTIAAGTVYLPGQALPDGRGNSSYNATIAGATGTGLTYTVSSGALPPGLSLAASTGVISGAIASTTADQDYYFNVKAANATSNQITTFLIPVRANGTGGTPPVERFGLAKSRYYFQKNTATAPAAYPSGGFRMDVYANGFSAKGLGDAGVTVPISANFAIRQRHLLRTDPLSSEVYFVESADSLAALEATYPAALNYSFSFNARTSGSSTFTSSVNLGTTSFPPAPVAAGTLPSTLAPASALPISWSAWTTGKSGVQQFIVASVVDADTGEIAYGTYSPLSAAAGAVTLASTATGITVPANTLENGKNYYLELSYHNVIAKNTVAVTNYNSALGLVEHVTTTILPFATTLGGWATSNTLAAPADIWSADPDGDGRSNLMEYAFLGNPSDAANPLATDFDGLTDPALVAAAPIRPGPVVTANPAANSVTIRHPLRKNTADLAYLYQTSSDCVTWTPVVPTTTSVIYSDDDRQLMEVTLPLAPAVGSSKVFVRLKVQFTEP